MTLSHSPSIVRDGLFSLYDPKNIRSYSGSGTTLVDIISGHNFTIYGSPTFNSNGYFEFADNQATQYMMKSSYPNPTTAVTYNIWFRSRFTSATQTPFTYSVNGNNEMLFFINNSTQLAPHPLGVSIATNTASMINVWVNFSWTRDSSTGTNYFYRDGLQVGTYTASAGTNITTNGYLIIGQESDSAGGGFDANQNLDGDFGFFNVYDRVLSANEIKQNFNALRGRYGI